MPKPQSGFNKNVTPSTTAQPFNPQASSDKEENKVDSTAEATTEGESNAQSFQGQSDMTANLCIKHFPEPVIYISEEPMCKKCIPEYLEKMKKERGEKKEEESEGKADA